MTQAQIHLSQNDEFLAKIIAQIPVPETKSTGNVFHDLLSCIIEQQIHYRSSRKRFQKLLEKAKIEELTLDQFEEFEQKALSEVKLSAQKFNTIAAILEHFEQQNFDWQTMSDEEVRASLSQIKGVGTWTIDMILLYTLERPNIFPVDDYYLKKIMLQNYPIDASARIKSQMKAIAKKWSPYRSTAVKHLLAWKDFPTA
ncbi:MAG: hypothetical protein AAF599_15940 [Bacteroidota bacterium]